MRDMTNALTSPPTPADWDELLEIIWREYLRVSVDESGRVRSNTEQHEDNVPAIERMARNERRPWTPADPYQDVGSASKYQRKRRLDFDRLLDDLEGGTFGAHVLVLWESSRGSRKVWEWSRMLEACEATGVRIFVTSHHRLYDPAVPRDWKALMEEAVDSEHESRKTSKRVKRSTNSDATSGAWSGGRRPFGYEADGVTLRPVEVEIINECVRRLLAGDSIRAIAVSLNDRGVLTAGDNAWHPGTLRKVLSAPRLAGKRVHNGAVVCDAVWPAIVDDITHRRILATLAARTSTASRGRTPWVLTGFLRCGRCDANLMSQSDGKGGRRSYACRKAIGYHGCGGLSIKADDLEALLGDLVTRALVDLDARRTGHGPDDAGELARLDWIALQRVEIADDKAAGVLSREQAREDAAALDRLQRTLQAAIAAKTRDNAPLDFAVAEGFVGRPWADLTVAEQRVILTATINHVTVAPATRRGSTEFEAERVTLPGRIDWKD